MSELGQVIIAEVRKVAAALPDFVYEPLICRYMDDDGCPGCIMGHALFNLGFLPTDKEIENATIGSVLIDLELNVDYFERIWLDRVQAAQDGRVFDLNPASDPPQSKVSWGRAIQYADEMASQHH